MFKPEDLDHADAVIIVTHSDVSIGYVYPLWEVDMKNDNLEEQAIKFAYEFAEEIGLGGVSYQIIVKDQLSIR